MSEDSQDDLADIKAVVEYIDDKLHKFLTLINKQQEKIKELEDKLNG